MEIKITEFVPRKDITTYELACCTKILLANVPVPKAEWDQTSPSVTRHFKYEEWDRKEWEEKVRRCFPNLFEKA